MLWSHSDCRLRVTTDQLIFEDFEDDAYSFTIPLEVLQHAKIDEPRGALGSHDDVLIILENGEEYEFGLEDGVKPKLLEVLHAIWDERSRSA